MWLLFCISLLFKAIFLLLLVTMVLLLFHAKVLLFYYQDMVLLLLDAKILLCLCTAFLRDIILCCFAQWFYCYFRELLLLEAVFLLLFMVWLMYCVRYGSVVGQVWFFFV